MIFDLIWEKILDGGPLMFPIGVLSFFLWYRIIERFMWFRREEQRSAGLLDGVREGLSLNQLDQALSKGWKATCLGALVLKGTSGFRKPSPSLRPEQLQEVLLNSDGKRTKYLSSISALATAAPLLGLLGTVTGMIGTFRVITHGATEDMAGMAGGISEALITTQAGLLVALPAVFLYGILSRKSEALQGNLEAAASELPRILARPGAPKTRPPQSSLHSGGKQGGVPC